MPVHQTLIEKLDALPANRLHEVEDFVDFLRHRDQGRLLVHAASASAFAAIWNNPEDDVYDGL